MQRLDLFERNSSDGRGALNQTIKAVVIAWGFVALSNVNLVFVPGFKNFLIDNEERTAIKLILGPRKKG